MVSTSRSLSESALNIILMFKYPSYSDFIHKLDPRLVILQPVAFILLFSYVFTTQNYKTRLFSTEFQYLKYNIRINIVW